MMALALPGGAGMMALALPALAALAGLLAGGYAGHEYAAAQGRARLAQCEQTCAEMRSRAATQAQIRLNAAAHAAALALRDESRRREAAEIQTREVNREIRRVAVGRPCLSGELAGVLNRAPGIAGADLSAAAGEPAGAAAAAAEAGDAHGAPARERASYLDDGEIAEWISEAGRRYELCRGRIDALRAWRDGVGDGRY